ncbi:hypothetical protein V497_04167 [Pseudogymnoascus sp. VKM F-4516 (FW-969)]|nr:hypothetical protein V497_04167 [Pseudogymnoascus sp. VKM F-4516 (FW-969)]
MSSLPQPASCTPSAGSTSSSSTWSTIVPSTSSDTSPHTSDETADTTLLDRKAALVYLSKVFARQEDKLRPNLR